ncbi:MAG: hypothetical protein J5741_01635 [Bacteroidales bacterium]|nr:hypothetical protein [Bacteroidales bacterium]
MKDLVLITETPTPDVAEYPLKVEHPMPKTTMALVKDDDPQASYSILPPESVQTLVENHVIVYMQHGFGTHAHFTDEEYAEAGVVFEDDFTVLASLAKVLVKQTDFTEEELEKIRPEQILFSSQNLSTLSEKALQLLLEKKAAAFAWDLLHDDEQGYIVDKIFSDQISNFGITLALSNLLLPLLLDLLIHPKIRYALQKNPQLMQCVYCYDGTVCHQPLADRFMLPWKDIISLCWDLN